MRTERLAAAGALLLLLAAAAPLRAQDPLTGVGPGTEVASIGFRFDGEQSFEEEDLARRIALTGRGSIVFLRRAFGFLPFVPPVGRHPFDPLDLQRDAVRIRNHVRESGYPDATVGYDLSYDAESDLIDVTFVIRQGPPLLVDSLVFVDSASGAPFVPEAYAEDWEGFVQHERERDDPFGQTEALGLEDRTIRWLGDRGFPFADADVTARIDTAANRADVAVRVASGPRMRVGRIEVVGNETVPAGHLARQLPISVGDWYHAGALEEGRKQLIQIDLVRLALVEVVPPAPGDSGVTIRLRVAENPPRLVRGEAGVASGGGLSGQASWTHRSAFGGLRSLAVTATAQTGALSFEQPGQQLYRGAVTLFQPYVGHRRLSASIGPFVEYRDDLRDRSRAFGLEASLVYAADPLRSVTLGYSLSRRRVFDPGLGDDLTPDQYLPLLGFDPQEGTAFDEARDRSVLSLSGTYGILDQLANPRSGYVIRPRIELAPPDGLNTSQYVLLTLGATGYLPVDDRIGFTVRGAVGRIYPIGETLDDAERESPLVSLLRLRDVTFTAGGSRDLRGWGSQLVGPKLPEVKLEEQDGVEVPVSDRYTPLGGLARAFGSVELLLPVPGMGDAWQTFVFLDAARVWTPDRRFAFDAGLEEDRFHYGTGVGVGYETIVGAVQVAVGYKLNPSPLDLRPPDAVLDALHEGRPIESVPAESSRRFHLHFSIGATF